MTGRDCDIAVVGGGLAGGLIALALAQQRPYLTVRLIEAGDTPGGNHRWSWFETDLDPDGERLLAPFRKTCWDNGYTVAFPGHRRLLASRYRSLASEDFAAALARELPAGTLLTGTPAKAIDAQGVTLADGRRIVAGRVIDARGFAPSPHLSGGWQVFMGRTLKLDVPHGLEHPMIMDATVEQHGGYRFVYVLPLGATEIFIEDTYYQDRPVIDRAALAERISAYAAARGWAGTVVGEEAGLLPVITGGDFASYQEANRIAGVAVVGARGGFSHPLTSYTLPFAVATALAVAAHANCSGEELAARMEARAIDHWRATGFYRLLGRMLMGAARPEKRYKVFERFYRLPESLIERFYAARSTRADRLPILVGKPPVPLLRAVRALVLTPPALADEAQQELE